MKELTPDLFGGSDDEQEDEVMKAWPDYFDVDAVQRLVKTELKAKPRMKSISSIGTMLQDCNIRD